MIVIHDTVICKPGQASKMAKMFLQMKAAMPNMVSVLTDMTGPFNKVIMVSQYEDLAAYQQSWEDMKNPTPEMQKANEAMKEYTNMYQTGSREIYKVNE